ncbi:dual specificity phosphatase dupd1 [Plakobranchus ocellatus]|uniref:Dual specificity protein phosphatase n=1 Tax=Plakobranchus ocellatus TaxID=259542 RepID=A0AAV3ZYC2_9GAST|nr:dual specificity phosphatase dupd1 [Plakobranchus ocellatus]
MAGEQIDLKLFSEVKHVLAEANNDTTDAFCKAGVGAFKYFAFPMPPKNSYDEVYDNILLGDNKCVKRVDELEKMGVTHVVNASMGSKFNQTNTDAAFYEKSQITYHGIPAMDTITFKLLPYLRPAADFIEKALTQKGRVYVHCQQGISRSSTVVIAFLMIYREMNLLEAVKYVRSKRLIYPNDGFLKQLCVLQKELNEQKEGT